MRVLARPDGTDLRSGSQRFEIGATVRAPDAMPFRLVRSPIELVTLGAMDVDASRRPLRVFDVNPLNATWDHASAMEGYPYQLGIEVEVLAEVSLITALGFDPLERVRGLRSPQAGALDEDRIRALIGEFLAICSSNAVVSPDKLDVLRALPVRFEASGSPPDLHELIANEAHAVTTDATNLAACEGSHVHEYLANAAAIAARYATEESAERIVHAYLLWELVAPLLEAPPRPLANLFAPLVELIVGGALLVGWTESACVVRKLVADV